MENHLLELIKSNNRIIIPNFGAFIISREKGLNILFNNFLSFNDGLLINHVSSSEGIPATLATEKVVAYVKEMQEILDSKGSFTIPGVGTFTRDENRVLRFDQDELMVTVSPRTQIGFEPKSQGGELLDLDLGIDEKRDLVPPAPIAETKPPAPQPVKPTPSKSPPPTATKTPPQRKVIPKPEPAPPKVKPPQSDKSTKRGISPIVGAIIVLILLLLVGAYLWFFTTLLDNIKWTRDRQPAIEQVVEPQPPVEAPVVEMPAEDLPVPPPPVPAGTRQHHIIVGSFTDEGAAARLVSVLRDKGVASATILSHEGRFLVSADHNSSLRQAYQRQEELLNELQMENWIITITAR